MNEPEHDRRLTATAAAPAVAGTLAALAILVWTRNLAGGAIVLAALLTAFTAVALRVSPIRRSTLARRAGVGAVAILFLAVLSGAFTERQFGEIEFAWDRLVGAREARLATVLDQEMARVVDRGREAARRAAAATDTTGGRRFDDLVAIRRATGVDALAIFSAAGDLRAWAGDHRGHIPDAVMLGAGPAHFAEQPLYSYLYFTVPVEGRAEHAVAAVLVGTALATGGPVGVVPATVRTGRDVHAVFQAGRGTGPGVVWSLASDGDTVVHARLERITQAGVRQSVEAQARRVGVAAALLALVFLSVAWLAMTGDARSRLASSAPLIVGAMAFAVAPIGRLFGAERTLPELLFVVPLAGSVSPGVVIAVLAMLAGLVATSRLPLLRGRAHWVALLVGALAVAVAYPAGIRGFLDAADPSMLEGGGHLWFELQVAAVLLLTIVAALAMPGRQSPLGDSHRHLREAGLLFLVAGLACACVLGVVVVLRLNPTHDVTTRLAALWAVPFALTGAGVAFSRVARGPMLRWLSAGVLAATAVFPHFWVANMNARLEAAAREVSSLGAQTSAFVDYKLSAFGREVTERAGAGEDGVQLLYRSFVASGLAQEPYPARIGLWTNDSVPDIELRLGGASPSDEATMTVSRDVSVFRGDTTPHITVVPGIPTVTRVLTATLDESRVATVAIGPRRTLDAPSIVGPVFGGVSSSPDMRLKLADPTRPWPPLSSEITWVRGPEGWWRSEALVRYPEGDRHAHLELRETPLRVRLARAVLLLTFDLLVLAAIWTFGRAARGAPTLPARAWVRWLRSFRGRVTATLFVFFLAPTVLFGLVAYRALAGVVVRAARTIAERAVSQAVDEYDPPEVTLRELSLDAGTDVLRYYYGELADVSSPEALELGVYGAWMRPSVFRTLQGGEEATAQDTIRVGAHSYLVAYQNVRPFGTLAVPMPLSAGDVAIRQRELADLILLTALIGGIMSLALSVLVGRTLAGPIGRLRRAAAAVGAGQLRVRLPESQGDEFGDLFASFNRMVKRLRRARAQEVRAARVLAWGEMAQQVAHEIKNPLTPIKLAVQHIRRAYRDGRGDFPTILEDSVEQILTEIDRLSEIARAFSRYGAPGELAGPLEAVQSGAVIHEALMLYRTGDANVDYREDVAESLPPVWARGGELKEVVLNLVENARNALDGREGRIVIAADYDGEWIEVRVEDDGPGIPSELLPRVFEPHFSTRSTGTGLGLAIVRRLVESWGGTVSAESEAGRGTVIRIRLVPAETAQRTL